MSCVGIIANQKLSLQLMIVTDINLGNYNVQYLLYGIYYFLTVTVFNLIFICSKHGSRNT